MGCSLKNKWKCSEEWSEGDERKGILQNNICQGVKKFGHKGADCAEFQPGGVRI